VRCLTALSVAKDYVLWVIDEDANGALVEWYWQGKTEVHGGKLYLVPLCIPQSPRWHCCDWTMVSAIRKRYLTL